MKGDAEQREMLDSFFTTFFFLAVWKQEGIDFFFSCLIPKSEEISDPSNPKTQSVSKTHTNRI